MTALIRALWLIPALALAGCRGDTVESPKSEIARKPEVTVIEVHRWQTGATRALPGVVSPGKRAVLSTRMSGTLQAVIVEPGDRISTGQHLATVDSREVKSAISAAQVNIRAAESALQQARREQTRLQRLYEEDLIARVTMERASVRVDQSEARLQGARTELQAQQANLDYTRLSAPFDGQVVETLVDAGSFVGPGQALMVLEARDTLRIDVPVSSQIAASLKPGQEVSVVVAEDGRSLPARLTGVIPALGNASTGQRLRLTMNSEDSALAPGQVVTVFVPVPDQLPANDSRQWLALPESALIRRGQLTGVLVLEQNDNEPVIQLKWIETANLPANSADKIPVTEGLSAGDKVVLAPSSALRDGQKVTVKSAGADNGQQ